MHEMIVKLTWDADNLGPMWMNPDNLALFLYSKNFSTEPELLRMDVVDHTEWRGNVPSQMDLEQAEIPNSESHGFVFDVFPDYEI